MLVNDLRSLPIMNETGYPVCYDATHSIQMPTSMGNISGGQREYIPYLVRQPQQVDFIQFLWRFMTIQVKRYRSKYCLEFKIFKKILEQVI